MPRKRKDAVEAICAECGASFVTTRSDAKFCGAEHQRRFGNRMAVRGKVLAPYVMAWIAGKGGGHSGVNPIAARAMRELTSIARDFIDEDREAGRPSALGYVEGLLAHGLYVDRKRR